MIVQFVVASLTMTPVSFVAGSWSRPARAGSRSFNSPGVAGPAMPMRAQRCRPSSSIRSPYHEGTKSSVSSSAWRIRARLTCMSKYSGSTKRAPWR